MTDCATCGTANPSAAKFCLECGGQLAARTCPSCGFAVERGRFCGECGAALDGSSTPVSSSTTSTPPIAERRVTSVLFADLVGFTPLSEARDAEDVRELLSRYFDECRTVIGRYGGVVEKFIGDAVMAVWGVPVAHEDDAERAVRAGMELVQSIAGMGEDVGAPGLAMRVGVVTGEVAVTVGATAEGMVAGDAVNTAARVQSAAEPGQVWVDATTRSLAAAAIAFDDTGEHELKGKSGPLRLWRASAVVAEVGGGQRVDGLEAPLTGRDRELRLLKELFHATEESMRPRLVVLDGEPGIGKSRIAWEFEKYADGLSATVRWHRGRCLSYGDGVAFWALAEAVRSRLGLVESDSADVASERLDTGLAEIVEDEDERGWLRPRIAALVGAGPTGNFAREELFAAWTTFFERVGADGRPVVLVIDDAQYADGGLLDFIEHLLVSGRAGIFVLALARPELLARRPDLGGRRTSAIHLDPLDDTAMGSLIDGLVEGLPEDARRQLVARAEGVPLFAVETVRTLIDRDAVLPRNGRYVLADGITLDLDAVGAPASLQALVAARLDALTADERRLVADACVLGASFTRDGLAAVAPDRIDLDEVLSSLQRKEILAVQQDRFSTERGQFRFVQGVVRQVAYATQSKRDRKARHLAAADYMSGLPDDSGDLAMVIAQHLMDAVDASSAGEADVELLTARARELLMRAGDRAVALGSPAEGLELYLTALERATDASARATVLLPAVKAALYSGRNERAVELARLAVDLLDADGRPIEAGIAAGLMGDALIALGDNATAIAVTEPRWVELEEVEGAEHALLGLSNVLSTAHGNRAEFDVALPYLERRLFLAEEVKDYEALSHALIVKGIVYVTRGAPITARGLYEAAAGIAREHNLTGRLAQVLINLTTMQMCRDLASALEFSSESVAVSRRSGRSAFIDYAVANGTTVLWTVGRLTEARTLVDEALERVSQASMRVALMVVKGWLADALGEPLPLFVDEPATDSISDRSWVAARLIQVAWADGNTAQAAEAAEDALPSLLAAGGLDDDFMHLWPTFMRAALSDGDLERAERLLQPVTTAHPGILTPAVSAQFHRFRALLGAARGEDPAGVEAEFRAGIDALTSFGAKGIAAQAREELGSWLIEQGRPAEAALPLKQARETYAEIGAVGWLERLEARHLEDASTPL